MPLFQERDLAFACGTSFEAMFIHEVNYSMSTALGLPVFRTNSKDRYRCRRVYYAVGETVKLPVFWCRHLIGDVG